jgi:membrane dipeptidase
MLELVGEDGVGLGSDFDGAKVPSRPGGAAGLQNLVAAMTARGFDQPLIEKVCFKNWLRVFGQTWRADEPTASGPCYVRSGRERPGGRIQCG